MNGCDNQLTPYLLVDATQPYTDVPQQFVKDGQIVINIVPHAVHQLLITNEAITFQLVLAEHQKTFMFLFKQF